MTLARAITQLVEKQDLTVMEAEQAMRQVMSGEATPAQIAALLVALRMKGETVPEIAGCAMAMRSCAEGIRPRAVNIVDTCGTGGDGAGTFNISTTAAFVVAGAGLPVAKHGNRSVSSRSGSADVLEALGVDLSLTPPQVQDCIDNIGIGFLFATTFHRAMRYAAGPRKELGIRTVFNLLGPLTNPANARYQLLGVYSAELTETIAHVLREIGIHSALVVHGYDGLDELTLTGPSRVSQLKDSKVTTFEVTPEDYGLKRCRPEDLKGGNPVENAAITRAILTGEERGPKRHVVLLNAAAALVAAEKANGLHEGVRVAAESIDSGAAYKRLLALVNFTQELTGRLETGTLSVGGAIQ